MNATSTPEKDVGMNVDLPESLHRRIKVAAATEGTTMKAVIIAAIEAWLGR